MHSALADPLHSFINREKLALFGDPNTERYFMSFTKWKQCRCASSFVELSPIRFSKDPLGMRPNSEPISRVNDKVFCPRP